MNILRKDVSELGLIFFMKLKKIYIFEKIPQKIINKHEIFRKKSEKLGGKIIEAENQESLTSLQLSTRSEVKMEDFRS